MPTIKGKETEYIIISGYKYRIYGYMFNPDIFIKVPKERIIYDESIAVLLSINNFRNKNFLWIGNAKTDTKEKLLEFIKQFEDSGRLTFLPKKRRMKCLKS